MSDMPPDWAIDKVLLQVNRMGNSTGTPWAICEVKQAGETLRYSGLVLAFARYIASKEEPPVDPLLIEARKVAAEVRPEYAGGYLSGEYDVSSTEVKTAMAALKRGMELAKEQSNG